MAATASTTTTRGSSQNTLSLSVSAVGRSRDNNHSVGHAAHGQRSSPAAQPLKMSPEARQAQPRKIDWPRPVREYVQRSFAPENSIPDIGRGEMEEMLKRVITEAAENNTLYLINWETLPLPQQMIQNKKVALFITSTSNGVDRHRDPRGKPEDNETPRTSKKRKSSELTYDADHDSQLPWRKANNRKALEDRMSNPCITLGGSDSAEKRSKRSKSGYSNGTSKYEASNEKRRQRFRAARNGNSSPVDDAQVTSGSPTQELNTGPVIGTCRNVEKNYFRLTSAPKPETVRPLDVLQTTLDFLKKKWKNENNYAYICDQFKSLRQDLTVQHIKNDFTVSVYEIHARIALEKGDLGEYNQCQTVLRTLYAHKVGGHPAEFLAYRILYHVYTCNRTEMNDVLANLTDTDKRQPAVKHALDVRSTLALGNYHKFFRLYLDAPNMGAYLMDIFIVRERLAALANICRAYRPDVGIRFLTEELAFESDQECAQFLCDHGAENLFLQGENGVRLVTSKAGSIFSSAKETAFRKVDIKGQV